MKSNQALYLGIDQGSSSTKAVLVNQQGELEWSTKIPVSTTRRGEREVEQDGIELVDSVQEVFNQVELLANRNAIRALGFACQRSGVIAWDKESGKPFSPLITHRDSRTWREVANLSAELIEEKTTLELSPRYAAPKFSLLQAEYPSALVGTLDSFLLNRFSTERVFATEAGMASRTMLFNLSTAAWDQDLCAAFKVSKARLPSIQPSLSHLGSWGELPVLALLGDQQAALYSSKERAVLNLGTIASLCVRTGEKFVRVPGYISSIEFSDESGATHFYLEGVNSTCGVLIELISRELGRAVKLDELTLLAESAGARQVVGFFPVEGVGAGAAVRSAPNAIANWDEGDKESFIRAVLEHLGNAIAEMVLELKAEGVTFDDGIMVMGGLSNIDFLLQRIADCSSTKFIRAGFSEATALGIARAAIRDLSRATDPEKPKEFLPRQTAPRFKAWQKLKRAILAGELPEGTKEYEF